MAAFRKSTKLVVVAFVMLAALSALFVIYGDCEEYDDSALLSEAAVIPDADNACTWYTQAVDSMMFDMAQNDSIYRISIREIWDEAFVVHCLEANRKVFPLVDAGNACLRFQAPAAPDASVPEPDWIQYYRVYRLLELKVLLDVAQHNSGEALQDLLRMNAYVRRFEEGSSSVTHNAMGLIMLKRCEETLRYAVDAGVLDSGQQRELIDWKEQHPLTSLGEVRAWKSQFAMLKTLVDSAHATARFPDGSDLGPFNDFSTATFHRLFRLNRTKKLLAQKYERILNQISTPYAQLSNSLPGLDDAPSGREGFSLFSLHLVPNRLGKYFVDAHVPVFGKTHHGRLFIQWEERANLILMAMRVHHAQQDVPVRSLEQLTPGILAKVPDDPFGRGAILYDSDLGSIRSVGLNRLDDHGSVELLEESLRVNLFKGQLDHLDLVLDLGR
ncbi:MAG: hypothetical protein KC488_09400 [Candidatus Cloacimonetes bacterium]|nr:hypothetical protein [Candidatus Cloacimonadota bacterium]